MVSQRSVVGVRSNNPSFFTDRFAKTGAKALLVLIVVALVILAARAYIDEAMPAEAPIEQGASSYQVAKYPFF